MSVESYGGSNTIWDETDVIGVTRNIMNDVIAVSTTYLTEDMIQAIQESYLSLAQTEEGLEIMSVYSQQGYVIIPDSDYDSVRAASLLTTYF